MAACADTVCISFSVNYLAVLRIRMDLWSNSVSIRNCLRRKSGAVDRDGRFNSIVQCGWGQHYGNMELPASPCECLYSFVLYLCR